MDADYSFCQFTLPCSVLGQWTITLIGALFLAITRTPSVFQSMEGKLSAMTFFRIQNLYDIKSLFLIVCFSSKAENQLELQQLYQYKNSNHDAVIPRLHIRNYIFLVVNLFNNCIYNEPWFYFRLSLNR